VNKYGTDALRYYLIREIPTGRDGDFSDKLFVERYNTDLANNLGNLVNRVHSLISRNNLNNFVFDRHHEPFKEKVDETWKKFVTDMNEFNLHEAVFHVWRLIDYLNKKIDEEKPWTLLKTDIERGKAILFNILEAIRHISIMLTPIIPRSAARIRQQLGLPIEIDQTTENGWGIMKNWEKLGEGSIIFPRIETKS
jgi:methionyl-tRNA synthetase